MCSTSAGEPHDRAGERVARVSPESPWEHGALVAVRDAAAQVSAWQAVLVDAVTELASVPLMDRLTPTLAYHAGLTPTEAAQVVELADRLTELPALAEVMRSGERSLGTVAAIARRATPENEAVLVERSQTLTAAALVRMLREYDRVVAPSDRDPFGDDPDTRDRPTTIRLGTSRDGRRRLTIDLDPSDAAELTAALDTEMRRQGDVEAEPLTEPAEIRRGAALMGIVTGARCADADKEGFAADSVQATLVIHATEQDDGLRIDRAVLDGDAIPDWMVRMLVERGELTAVVAVDGEPLIASVPDRFATRRQRRALLARDGGCTYPGCGSTRGLIAHHLLHWDDGGPTRLDNLTLLCRRHHRVVHRHHLRLRSDGATPTWEHPDGTPLEPRWPHRPRFRRTPPGARNTGVHGPLTEFTRDTILHTWLTAA